MMKTALRLLGKKGEKSDPLLIEDGAVEGDEGQPEPAED
jgi:hypothetical protein